MSLSRATFAALRAVAHRPTVATRSTSLLATSTTATTPSAIRNYVKPSAPRPQATNKDNSEPPHAGSFARTDDSITVEYPEDHELPSSEPVTGAGRAGMHVYPTLATFSLEGKVTIVTGGARGLGLVMGQGMVVSGADLAIVDMNKEEAEIQAKAIMDQFKKDNPNAKKCVSSSSSSSSPLTTSSPSPSPTSQLNHQSAVSPTTPNHLSGGSSSSGRISSSSSSNNDTNTGINVNVNVNKNKNKNSNKTLTANGFRSPRVTAHYADVSDPESVKACIADILAQHGRIDNLVTSAGFTENFQATDYPIDRFRKLFAVNVDGTYLFATAVARHLMERKAKGNMVFVGSMSGAIVNVPQPQAPYNSAKAAVRHMAASLAVEWAHAGIRVNCISPGYMLTALTQKILDDNPALKKQWISLIPQGKMGSPEDLMGPVTFLLSDAANYVTGADIRVDGGYTVT